MSHQQIYETLRQAAVEGKTLSYADIAPMAGLDMSRVDHRNRIAAMLDEISSAEHEAGRPLLSAIVVHGGVSDDAGLPGGGFFTMARRLGVFKSGDRSVFHAEEMARVFNAWRGGRATKEKGADMDVEKRIQEPVIKRDGAGRIQSVRLVFGPHHFVEVHLKDGRVHCAIGATHHGVHADAADVPSELESMIDELRRLHPDRAF